MAKETPLTLYHRLRMAIAALPSAPSVARYTKSTLVHISHSLEGLILSEKIPAVIFTGFQESSHWRKETERYNRIADTVNQVFIFAGKPLPPESQAKALQIELDPDDQLRQEWFLLILSAEFSALLCGLDNLTVTEQEAEREFDTILSFDPDILNLALDVLKDVLAYYRPQSLAPLQAAIDEFGIMRPNLRLITQFSQDIIKFEELLSRKFREAHAALAEQRSINDLLVETSPIFIVAVDRDQKVLLANDSLLKVCGYPRGQVIGRDFTQLFIKADDLAYLTRDAESQQKGCILPLITREKSTRYVRWYVQRVTGQTMSFFTGIDITEQKLAEENLRESESSFRMLVQSITHHIYMWTHYPDGTTLNNFSSPTLQEFTGYPSLTSDKEDFDFWPNVVIHPDDRAHALLQTNRLLRGQPYSTVEYRIRRANGDLVWVQDSARTVIGDEGEITVYGVIDDITDRKRVEEIVLQQEKLRIELEKERELSEVRKAFMTTVSHEFRTPLAIILSSAERIERYADLLTREQKLDRIKVISAQVDHMRRMLDDIDIVLQSERQTEQFKPDYTHLIDLVTAIVDGFREHDNTPDRLQLNFEVDDPIVYLDVRLFRHILSNLISNALKYSPASTPVEVGIVYKSNNLILTVRDYGIGIPIAERDRVFEPFYRASNATDVGGTGLGLKIVQDYVNLYNGSLNIHTEPGQGSIFTVRLPVGGVSPSG